MVNVIDYMPGDTLLHRLNPVIKLGLAAAIIIGIFLSDTYVALLGFLALTLALGAYAGVVDRLFSLLKLLIPLALIMLALQLAFMRDGNVVWGFVTDEGLKEVNDDRALGASALKSFQEQISKNPRVAATMANAEVGDLMPSVPEMSRFWYSFQSALKYSANGRQTVDDALQTAAMRISQ